MPKKTPQLVEWIEGLQIDWSAVLDQVYTFLQHGALNLVGGLVCATVSVVSGMVSFFHQFCLCRLSIGQKGNFGAPGKDAVVCQFTG